MEPGPSPKQRNVGAGLAALAATSIALSFRLTGTYQATALTAALLSHFGLLLLVLFHGAGTVDFEPQVEPGPPANQANTFTDPLTGVASRNGAIRHARYTINRHPRVYCVVLDVDDFKQVNAHLGSEAGDELLCTVAATIDELLPDWHIGRIGGDEFVAFGTRELTEWERGALTALELRTSAGTRIGQLSAGETNTTVSGHDVDLLLRDAQTALRSAKAGGKQRIVAVDTELRNRENRRREISNEVRTALEEDELTAWGQPIFDLETDTPAGIELLARWPRRNGRFESPELFIPVIETLGLSSLLGGYMLRQAVDVLRHMTELGDATSFVTVNLSARHLAEPLLPSLIAVQLDTHCIAPERLIVELTESERLPDSPLGRSAIGRLRSIGVGVATDDLGAGWSSLTQMMRSRFTHVKTDRELISATMRPGGTELIEAIRMLAEHAEQTAIAEGIETEAELREVKKAGFRYGQGWFLGRPSPLEATLVTFGSEPFDEAALADENLTSDEEVDEAIAR